MSRTLVIATHNTHKAGEMIQILSARFPDLELKTLNDYPGAPEPEETGETYEENATIKAEAAVQHTGEWCLADDAGLEIDALGGMPGVQSKRFAGEETSFAEKMEQILGHLADLSFMQRTARFQCHVALARPEQPTELFYAKLDGYIGNKAEGEYGFGYDPIFIVPSTFCTMAELTPEQKHQVSHRGKVLALAGDRLQELLAES